MCFRGGMNNHEDEDIFFPFLFSHTLHLSILSSTHLPLTPSLTYPGPQRGVRAVAVARWGRHRNVRGPRARPVRAAGNGWGAAVAVRGPGEGPGGDPEDAGAKLRRQRDPANDRAPRQTPQLGR